MANFFKGITAGFLGFFVLGVFGFLNAQAATSGDSVNIGVTVDNSMYDIPGTPVIIDAYNITTDYMDLLVEVEDRYAGMDLDMVLTATRVDTGDVTTLTYDRVPGGDARTVLDVPNLLPGTYYDFVVRYSLDGMNIFSADSNVYQERTLIDPPVIDGVGGVSTDSLTLDVVIDPRFAGDSMDYIIEVTNEDSGDDYTIQVTKTTSSSSVSFDIDDLDPGAEYTFRVRYGRADTGYYSDWSEPESAVTDLDPPTITEAENITDDSMDLVVEISDDLSGEDIDLVISVRNDNTGDSWEIDFNGIEVNGDGTVTVTIDGLDPGTDYTFEAKYSPEGSGEESDWSDPFTATTTYTDDCEEDVDNDGICDDVDDCIDIDRDGICDDEDKKITICHNGNTIEISRNALDLHLGHGDYLGPCTEEGGDGGPHPTDPGGIVSGGETDVDDDDGIKEEVREAIAPEEAKNFYQTAGLVGATAGSIAALAGSAVPLFTAMPGAFSSSIFLKFIELFGIIGRRKEERNWGVVFDSVTRMPIPAAKIVLSDEAGKEMATTYSDKDGRFGFLTSPGKYKLDIFKKDYEVITDIGTDDLYGNVYDGGLVEMGDDHVILINIAMKSTVIDWEEYAQKKVKQYKSGFSTFKKYFFLAIYVFGFGATIVITYFYPSTFNFVVLGIYVILFIYQTFFKKKKYGSIETDGGNPVPFAVVSLHDEGTNEKKRFAVTDAIGRYYLLADNGDYKMKAKGQPVSGDAFEKQGDVKVDDGIVRKDIVV